MLKPQGDINRQLLSEQQKIASVGEDMEKMGLWHIDGGNLSWKDHCNKQYGS